MLQPPQGHTECPRCGYSKAILILDYNGLLPQLDSTGSLQYHCPHCAHVFTAFDIRRDEQGEERKRGENDAQDI